MSYPNQTSNPPPQPHPANPALAVPQYAPAPTSNTLPPQVGAPYCTRPYHSSSTHYVSPPSSLQLPGTTHTVPLPAVTPSQPSESTPSTSAGHTPAESQEPIPPLKPQRSCDKAAPCYMLFGVIAGALSGPFAYSLLCCQKGLKIVGPRRLCFVWGVVLGLSITVTAAFFLWYLLVKDSGLFE